MSIQTAAEANAAKRQSQMSQEIEHLCNTVDAVTEVVDQLNQRLSPVMRSEPSVVGEDDAKAAESLAPHANSIRGSRVKLDAIQMKLLDIQRKLEV